MTVLYTSNEKGKNIPTIVLSTQAEQDGLVKKHPDTPTSMNIRFASPEMLSGYIMTAQASDDFAIDVGKTSSYLVASHFAKVEASNQRS